MKTPLTNVPAIENIQNKIIIIRNIQVILDCDIADLYGVTTGRLNEQVKRNIDRFPEDFMFQLTESEWQNLISQNAISSWGGRRNLPFVFTEQGIASLSGVLKSNIATEVYIMIMRAFVQKGIFFEGQVFDAYLFVTDLVRNANQSIILIDNYIDESVLVMFTKKKPNVDVIVYTSKITKEIQLDTEKLNAQHPKITLKEYKKSHDRFMIIDYQKVYHVGASLKDLGKKWFAFSIINIDVHDILKRLT